MQLLIKQRIFSWFDSFDVCDQQGQMTYSVVGQFDFGHRLEVYDSNNQHVATLKQEVISLLPRFYIEINDQRLGTVTKDLNMFMPSLTVDFNGWFVQGDVLAWHYQIYDGNKQVATISKQILQFVDTYVLDISNEQDALYVLMVVLAIDAAQCNA